MATTQETLKESLAKNQITQAQYDGAIALNKANSTTVDTAQSKLDSSLASGSINQKTYDEATSKLPDYVSDSTKNTTQPIQQPTNEINKPETISKTEEKPKTKEISTENINIPDYSDNSPERLAQIQQNLENFYLTSPELYENIDTYKKTFDYDQRSEQQQIILDSMFSKKQKILASNNIYDNFTDQQIIDSISDGVFSQTQINSLKTSDPVRYADIQAQIEQKKIYDNANAGVSGDITAMLNKVGLGMTDTTVPDLQTKYDELVNTPEIVEMNKTLISKEEEIKNLQLELDNLEDSFEKQYPNATTGVLASRVADARASMNKDINTKINSYNATASMINSLKATGEAQYNTYKDQYELEVSQRNQRMSELGFAMDLMSYQTPAEQEESAWNSFIRQQDYVNGNIYSSDPATRKKAVSTAVDGVLSEFSGITMLRSRDEMVEDITELVNGGMSLGDAITENIREPIMGKKEYKIWSAEKFGITDTTVLGNIKRDNTTNSWIAKGEGEFTAEDLGRPAGSTNVGADTNNYGNFVNGTGAGNIGTYDSTNGRTYSVFATAEDGYNALINDLKSKQSGNSDYVDGNSTVEELINTWVHGEDGTVSPSSSYYKAVQSVVGDMKQSIGSIDTEKLAEGIMKGEGTRDTYQKGGVDLTGLAGGTSTSSNIPTASELAYYERGALGIDPTGKDGITEARYDEIANYQKTQEIDTGTIDSDSMSILRQTGLNSLEFDYLTQGTSALARLTEDKRMEIINSATEFLNKNGVDLSTFKSRYSALNESIERTTKIMGNVQRDELEIQGTLDNLSSIADSEELSNIKRKTMVDYWAGKEVNDPAMVEYGFFLGQLREEIAGYNAALKGNSIATIADTQAAEEIIYNGLSSGGIEGLKSGMEKSIYKMGKNLPTVLDGINRQVWDLFGVGDNFSQTETEVTPTVKVRTSNQGTSNATNPTQSIVTGFYN